MQVQRFTLDKGWFISTFFLLLTKTILWGQSVDGLGYTDNAISIQETGEVVLGAIAIKKMNNLKGIINRNSQTIFGLVANRDSSYYYEMGHFNLINGEKYGYVRVWIVSPGGRQVELEFSALQSDFSSALVEIDKRRQEWIQLCNAHNAAALINELYAENTMYYNHKPLVVGRPGLIQDYQYMNRESYSLNLTPLKTEQVNDRIILEIGQCNGSYNGKYIIVWKKSDLGKWEVFLDSNI